MSSDAPVHVIAVYSPDLQTSDFLKRALDSSGFAAFAAPREIAALEGFVAAVQPAALVFDLATAGAQWDELTELCKRPPVSDIPMVITAGERKGPLAAPVDDRLVLTPVVEMFTHRDDLRELRTALRQVLNGGQQERWRLSGAARRAS